MTPIVSSVAAGLAGVVIVAGLVAFAVLVDQVTHLISRIFSYPKRRKW